MSVDQDNCYEEMRVAEDRELVAQANQDADHEQIIEYNYNDNLYPNIDVICLCLTMMDYARDINYEELNDFYLSKMQIEVNIPKTRKSKMDKRGHVRLINKSRTSKLKKKRTTWWNSGGLIDFE